MIERDKSIPVSPGRFIRRGVSFCSENCHQHHVNVTTFSLPYALTKYGAWLGMQRGEVPVDLACFRISDSRDEQKSGRSKKKRGGCPLPFIKFLLLACRRSPSDYQKAWNRLHGISLVSQESDLIGKGVGAWTVAMGTIATVSLVLLQDNFQDN